jgi:hypothetical protein
MFGAGLALTAVYFAIPTPFGGRIEKILPESCKASLEGPKGGLATSSGILKRC